MERSDKVMSVKAFLVNAGTGLVPAGSKGERLMGILTG